MNSVLKLVSDGSCTCEQCGEVKPLADFQHNVGHGKTRPTANCKACRSAKKTKTWAEKKASGFSFKHFGVGVALVEGGRVCTVCKVGKPWDQFAKEKIGYNQKTSACIPCRKEKFRTQYKKNPRVSRQGLMQRPDKLLKQYGITADDVHSMLAIQNGRCANLGCSCEIAINPKGEQKKAVIDHCHTTGRVRAMMCSRCNMLLGHVENNKTVAYGLFDYLNKYCKKGS